MIIENTALPSVNATRRRFLSNAAGLAAGGAVLALNAAAPSPAAATPLAVAANPDPIFSLIEAHKEADAVLEAIYARCDMATMTRKEEEQLLDRPWEIEIRTLAELVEGVPQTFAGLVAWVGYLSGIAEADEHRLGEYHFPVFLQNLSEALNAVVSS